ncbi:putative integral membrane protein [Caulobacter sp. AP07]|uniref:RcnB family protein n=1 Tax=Caulobacter sp. AP07 TaxID=1144304 RepID=UPI0002721166|nr:RcnB family protein [Caulobacter sp. AP07]EJL29610.1 putative integral membrane protein [Caulobacter sp. AP07]
MKRILLTIAAVAAVAGPMAVVANDAAAQDRGRWEHRDDRGDRGDRWGDRDGRHDRGRWDDRDGRHDNGRHRGWDRHDRWDYGRHNGYYYNNRWSYGPPPAYYYGRPGFRPGYSSWRRGGYLPPYYRSETYVIHDYGYYRLRPPPRGYYWYRTGNDYVLAAIATGLIFDIIND